MEFIKFVEQIPNVTVAKRVATAYVADYRRLSFDEIKTFLVKTAQQYTSFENNIYTNKITIEKICTLEECIANWQKGEKDA